MDYKTLKSMYTSEYSISDTPASGTVYTPEALAYEMIYLMLRARLVNATQPFISSECFEALYQGFLKGMLPESTAAEVVISELFKCRILDPACGSGMLLLAYAEFMAYLLPSTHYSKSEFYDYLSTSIFGIDIDEKALSVAKQLFLSFSNKGAQVHLLHKDSLTADISEKFDLIISNPPYIGEKGNLSVFKAVKQTPFGRSFYEGKMDYFYFFIYRAHALLTADGIACFLTSNYFFTADGAVKLRHFLKTQFFLTQLLDYGAKNAFGTRGLHACAYTLSHAQPLFLEYFSTVAASPKKMDYSALFDENEQLRFITDHNTFQQLSNMSQHAAGKLGAVYEIAQGLVSGSDRSGSVGVFVYTVEEAETLPDLLKPFLKPLYKNSAIDHYFYDASSKYRILYIDGRLKTRLFAKHYAVGCRFTNQTWSADAKWQKVTVLGMH